MGVGGQDHAAAALPPGKTRYTLYRPVFLKLCETAARKILFSMRRGPGPDRFTRQ